MEYQIITPADKDYPRKLIERLGDKAPAKLYYNGPLKLLDRWTLGFFCSDLARGTVFMEMNQILFTLREYEINFIGSWFAGMETEIFRMGLYYDFDTVVLFSAKGIAVETYDKYLLDRFYGPLGGFPEKDEYFRRAKDGELLMLSICDPMLTRRIYRNVMERNWIIAVLSDLIFIPYGPRGSKTYTTAKKIVKAKIPVFTFEHPKAEDLHKLGIPGFNRKTVRVFLEQMGAKKPVEKKEPEVIINLPPVDYKPPPKLPVQSELKFAKEHKKKSKTK